MLKSDQFIYPNIVINIIKLIEFKHHQGTQQQNYDIKMLIIWWIKDIKTNSNEYFIKEEKDFSISCLLSESIRGL